MAKGSFYPVYTTMYLYANAAQATTYGSNYASTFTPNTDSDKATWNCISSVEGKCNLYIDTAIGLNSPYYPAVALWCVKKDGGSGGFGFGWTNDKKNLTAAQPSVTPSSVTIPSGTTPPTYNTMNIKVANGAASSKYNIKWKVGTSAWTTVATNVAIPSTGYDWTITLVGPVYEGLPNDVAGVATLSVETINSGVSLGAKTTTFKVKIHSAVVPSLVGFDVIETNAKVKALGNVGFVAGVSTFSIQAEYVNPSMNATVTSVKAKLGSASYKETMPSSGGSLVLAPKASFGSNTSKSVAALMVVTDSRGRQTVEKKTITQASYNPPVIKAFTTARDNDADEKQVTIAVKATQTKLGNKNLLRYKLDVRNKGATSWTGLLAWTNFGVDDVNNSHIRSVLNNGIKEVRLTLQDSLGNETESIIELASTSRKWLEVTNGEDINVIGTLKNNGNPFTPVRISNDLIPINPTSSYSSAVVTFQVIEPLRLAYFGFNLIGYSYTESRLVTVPTRYKPSPNSVYTRLSGVGADDGQLIVNAATGEIGVWANGSQPVLIRGSIWWFY